MKINVKNIYHNPNNWDDFYVEEINVYFGHCDTIKSCLEYLHNQELSYANE